MNYEIETIVYDGGKLQMVNVTRKDGSIESFPVDETNPRYIQFLEETK
mgnify:CR=1 FL=1